MQHIDCCRCSPWVEKVSPPLGALRGASGPLALAMSAGRPNRSSGSPLSTGEGIVSDIAFVFEPQHAGIGLMKHLITPRQTIPASRSPALHEIITDAHRKGIRRDYIFGSKKYTIIGIVDNVDDFHRTSSTDDVTNVDDKFMFSSIALSAHRYAIHSAQRCSVMFWHR